MARRQPLVCVLVLGVMAAGSADLVGGPSQEARRDRAG